MRKLLLPLILAAALSLPIWAEGPNRAAAVVYRPELTSSWTRGGAILATGDVRHAFMGNPALLGSGAWSLNLPISLSLNNASEILTSDLVANLSDLASGDEERMVNAVIDFLRAFSGDMPFATLNEGLSFTAGGFGVALHAAESVLTSGGSVGTDLTAALDLLLSAGWGRRAQIAEGWALSAGITWNWRWKLLAGPYGAETAVEILTNPSAISSLPLMTGAALSTDVGLLVEMPLGFRAAAVFRDIGPGYEMTGQGAPYSISFEPAIDLALGWQRKWWFMSLALEAGMRGVNNIRTGTDAMRAFNCGASLGFSGDIFLNAGIDGGYPAFGILLDLLCFEIDAAWRWRNWSELWGLNPRDELAISLALGF